MDEIERMLREIWPEWKIEEEISDGRGSSSSVYKITREDLAGSTASALKVIRIRKNSAKGNDCAESVSEVDLRNVISEIQIMSSLKGHSNIVSIEDYYLGESMDGQAWIIFIRMELLTPLLEAIDPESITEEEITKIGIDICTALEVCGQKNIAHRDIKPENIFQNELGNYKLGDFGVSRIIEETALGQTTTGTPLYMAPEMSNRAFGNYNFREASLADIYSLGIVLYRLANQYTRLPFEPVDKQILSSADRSQARDRRCQGEKIPPPTKGSDHLKSVILKACEYEPGDRYQSAAELKHALAGEDVPSAGGNKKSHFPTPKLILFVVLLLMIAVPTTYYILRQIPPVPPEPDPVSPPCEHQNLQLFLRDGTEYGTGDTLGSASVSGWKGKTFWFCKDCEKMLEGTDQINYQVITPDQKEALDQRLAMLHSADDPCPHSHTISYFVVEEDDAVQLEENSTYHKEIASGHVNEYCALCGDELHVYEAIRMDDTPHQLNTSNECISCGYISTCVHDSIVKKDEIYEQSNRSYLPYDDFHSVSGKGIRSIVCLNCGSTISVEENVKVIIPDEAHLIENEVCVQCHYPKASLISSEISSPIEGFTSAQIEAGQELHLFAMPSDSSYIIGTVRTDQKIYLAGHENEWVLLACEMEDGSFLTGYADADTIKGAVNKGELLTYEAVPIKIRKNVDLQIDPVKESKTIISLEEGTKGAFLFLSRAVKDWAYIEVISDGVRYRGFVSLYAIEQDVSEDIPMKNAGTRSQYSMDILGS